MILYWNCHAGAFLLFSLRYINAVVRNSGLSAFPLLFSPWQNSTAAYQCAAFPFFGFPNSPPFPFFPILQESGSLSLVRQGLGRLPHTVPPREKIASSTSFSFSSLGAGSCGPGNRDLSSGISPFLVGVQSLSGRVLRRDFLLLWCFDTKEDGASRSWPFFPPPFSPSHSRQDHVKPKCAGAHLFFPFFFSTSWDRKSDVQ